jgi:hypothetical protein
LTVPGRIFVSLISMTLLLAACATRTAPPAHTRPFDFERDTFAYTNNNRWLYEFVPGPSGETVKHRLSHSDHTQRCTIMSRAARQFYHAARFDPEAPTVSDEEYRALIRAVLDFDPRRNEPASKPVTIPGYADLRSLSKDREELLQNTLGGSGTGHKQRGNWRMIFGFPPDHQRKVARELADDLARGNPPIVHIVNFPKIDINHTALVLDVEETPLELRFLVYDPNNAEAPVALVFDRATASFHYARTDYFRGGRARVYEIYDGLMF